MPGQALQAKSAARREFSLSFRFTQRDTFEQYSPTPTSDQSRVSGLFRRHANTLVDLVPRPPGAASFLTHALRPQITPDPYRSQPDRRS
jgi:hypothetical protein